MVGEDVVANITTELVSYVLPANVANSIGDLIFILKAAGVLAIGYLIYLVASGFLSFRKLKKLEKIEKRLSSMEKKLNKLLKKRKG